MTEKDQLKLDEAQQPAVTEKSPCVKGGVTTDDVIEELFRCRTWKYSVLILSLMVCWCSGPPLIYITSFAGIDPSPDTNWTCKSQKCEDYIATDTSLLERFPCSMFREEDGEVELILKSSDVEWEMTYTSFSVEFDLNCGVGAAGELKTLLSSMYFAGALLGLILGGFLYDHFGRKKCAMLGYFIAVFVTLAGTFCHNYYFLLIIRFFQGLGIFLVQTAMYIMCVELVPIQQKNKINGWAQILWALGYPLAAAIGYWIHDWNYMFLAAAMIFAVLNVQVFFCPESPRFHVINRDVESTKQSLKALQVLTTYKVDLDDIVITDVDKVQNRDQSLLRQIEDFFSYPWLLLETLMQMFMWLFIAMSYYGFNFGWGSIVPNRYLGYLMAAVGELIAYVSVVPLIAFIGRRRAMMLMFVGAALFFLIAIPEVKLGKDTDWTLESVCCLIGVIFISGCFSGIYLWTAELAPTSHRGLVFCMSSGAARIGSFIGPFIFNNLALITHKAVPLGGLAFLALLCALGSFFQVETGNIETALTGQDVMTRRRGHRYRLI